ncbi:hypothetical protein EPN42_11810 [bacterium]|nr:MAG: hypothetical protein EPN42_11810 [bacterium]
MSEIRERVFVACPLAHAHRYLAQVLPTDTSAEQSLVLRVPIPEGRGSAELEQEVTVQCAPLTDPSHESEVWRISWTPRQPAIYPFFDGRISIKAGEDYSSCRLVLEGNYEPPLGLPGRAFDAALGRRIAGITARELLRSIAKRMEESCRADEAHKQGEPRR